MPAALLRIGWEIAWQRGSHRRLKRPGWPNCSFAFHDNEEIGPALLPQIAKKTRVAARRSIAAEKQRRGAVVTIRAGDGTAMRPRHHNQ